MRSNILPPGETQVNMGVDNKICQANLAPACLFASEYPINVLESPCANNVLQWAEKKKKLSLLIYKNCLRQIIALPGSTC